MYMYHHLVSDSNTVFLYMYLHLSTIKLLVTWSCLWISTPVGILRRTISDIYTSISINFTLIHFRRLIIIWTQHFIHITSNRYVLFLQVNDSWNTYLPSSVWRYQRIIYTLHHAASDINTDLFMIWLIAEGYQWLYMLIILFTFIYQRAVYWY